MPALDANLHVASVQYACTFFGLSLQDGLVSFGVPNPVQFTFSFETGRTQPDPQVDLYDITWDYSWFSQPAVEAGIGVALGQICAAVAALLGTETADVEQSVRVQRVWSIAANTQGGAAPVQVVPFTWAEAMPYPPQVAGADTAQAGESGSITAR